ncbi:hypothetical protein B9Z55_028809 [Caenorhabditis nigoni]|uniref:Uncharacterized protein n=1 Tax=Caenorhabditis nigoni TaxID=1611254 RepID=A0A2G5S9Y2_9PELO|nr:hypothetical protein B9Z55_028809 [Caenorhabditis nigoni]
MAGSALLPQTWVIKPPLKARLPSSPLPAADTDRGPRRPLSYCVLSERITIQMYKIEYKKSKSLQHPGFPGRLRSKY